MRDDRSNIQNMVRCKIKGTGKKRWRADDDDQNCSYDFGCGHHCDNGEVTAKGKAPQVWVDDSESPELHGKETPSDLQDGDLLFFDGIPFHFLNTKLDVAVLNDSSVPDSDIDPLPFMLPPTFPALGSGRDLFHMEEVDEIYRTSSDHAAPRQCSRSIILDDRYNSYLNISESPDIPISDVGIERSQQSELSILGVFDHHFYDIHSPGTPAIHRYKDHKSTKNFSVALPYSNVTPMETWSNSCFRKKHVSAI